MRRTTLHFPWQALDDYNDLNRRVQCYPSSYRSRTCDAATGEMRPVKRTHYFATLFVFRHFQEQGLEVWHERYKLAEHPQCHRLDYQCMCEIEALMGSAVKRRIEQESVALGHPFRDPDLVTYDRRDGSWQFVEVKRADTNDKLRPEQERSLLLLERVVPASTAILLDLIPV